MRDKKKAENKADGAKEASVVPVLSVTPNMLPKWCNNVNFHLLDGKLIVMSLAYNEGQQYSYLIERVSIELPMLKTLRDTIDKLIEDMEKNAQ